MIGFGFFSFGSFNVVQILFPRICYLLIPLKSIQEYTRGGFTFKSLIKVLLACMRKRGWLMKELWDRCESSATSLCGALDFRRHKVNR